MSGTGDLEALLFDEDDSDHGDISRNSNMTALGTSAALPPPVVAPAPSAPPPGANMVHRLFGVLKQQLPAETFAQLTAELKTQPNQKEILNTVKQYAGEELFNKAVMEVRDTNSTVGVSTNVPTVTPPSLNGALAPPMSVLPPGPSSMPIAPPTSLPVVPTPPQTAPNSAKMLLEMYMHSINCSFPIGTCPRNKCAQFKKLIYHARACGKTPSQCDSCRKLLSLTRAHAQKCTETNCNVVFCNDIRQRSGALMKQEAVNGARAMMSNPATSVSGKAPAPAEKNSSASKYAETLRVILHVRKCTANPCPVGELCETGKTLWAQAQLLLHGKPVPNLLPGAKAYKEVVGHYNTCQNKSTCVVCRNSHLPLPGDISSNALKRSVPDSSSTAQPAAKKPKAAKANPKPAAAITANVQDLISIGNNDVRKESDLLAHTFVDLAEERRRMLLTATDSLDPEFRNQSDALNCKKEEWATNNYFSSVVLEDRMRSIAQKHGIGIAANISECLSRALQGYIKKVLSEVITNGANRCNARIKQQRHLLIHKEPNSLDRTTEAYRQNVFEQRHNDMELRRLLLMDAEKQETLERDRSKKRKKGEKSKAATTDDEKDEYDMDIEELAVKDLKEQLLQQRQRGFPLQEAPVDLPRSRSMVPQPPNQVVVDDMINWLRTQPSTHPKLFCRADMAMIMASKK